MRSRVIKVVNYIFLAIINKCQTIVHYSDRMMLSLWIFFLLCHGQAVSLGELSAREIVLHHFADVVQDIIVHVKYDNMIESLTEVDNAITSLFATCRVKNTESWKSLDDQTNELVICGSVGQIGYQEEIITWIITQIHPKVPIELNIIYLNLPFLYTNCSFAYVSISSQHELILCGKKTNYIMYSAISFAITLHHGEQIFENSAFLARYSSMMEQVMFSRYESFSIGPHDSVITPSVLGRLQQPTSKSLMSSTHIVTDKQNIIIISDVYDVNHVMLYDGPGTKSPLIISYNRNTSYYSSGFQAFIVSFVENGTFSYHTQPMINHVNNQTIIQLQSSQLRNVIFAAKVFGFNKMIIHHLRVDNSETLNEVGVVYDSAGVYVMAERGSKAQWFHHFLDTEIKEEFVIHTFHEIVMDSHLLYVYFYAGYSSGEVTISIETSNCFHLINTQIHDLVDLQVDCIQLEELIFPDQEHVSILEGELFNPGQLSLHIQLEELVYSSDTAIKMYVDEIDALHSRNREISRFIAARQYLTFDNLRNINLTILYQPRKLRTFQLLFVTVEMRSQCRNEKDIFDFSRIVENERYIVSRAISFCLLQVRGSSVYSFDILTRFSQQYIRTVVINYASSCPGTCYNATTLITEYNQLLDRKYIYQYSSLPIKWNNVRSLSSVHITVLQNKTSCSFCVLTIASWADTIPYNAGNITLARQEKMSQPK